MASLKPEERSANRLLTYLPQEDQDLLRQFLEPVVLEYKRPLYTADEPIEFVHFIESGVGSLVSTMANGQAAEVGTIGNEGVIGLPVLLGDSRAPSSMYVQVPGRGLRMRARAFRELLDQSPRMRAALLRYTHVFFNHIALTAACAHFHSLEQRCCRWLLMTHDRMRATGRRFGGGGRAATCRSHPLSARPHHDPRPQGPGGACLRVLRRHQSGIRSPARLCRPERPERWAVVTTYAPEIVPQRIALSLGGRVSRKSYRPSTRAPAVG